ncbi:MAG: ion channel protein Tsx [Halobacteriovorax sp.]|nr:ion channel protein Tsx [Halobacteriovorax sp.]
MKKIYYLLSLVILLNSSVLFASDWSSTNLQFLRGSDYKLGPKERTIMTLEHASGWKYGDNHFFFDITNPDSKDTAVYGEFTPSLSVAKLLGKDISKNLINDYRVVANAEFGNQIRTYLYGFGVSFNVKNFKFLKANLMIRDKPEVKGSTYQLTIAWLLPFEIGKTRFHFTGFTDLAGKEGSKAANQLIVPQLLIDVGNYWNSADCILVGVEYQYWKNKFGAKGTTESVPQAMMKFYF